MSVILNEDYEGGGLEFATHHHLKPEMEKTWKDIPGPGYKVETPEDKTGTVIVFPSDIWHRVIPITKGVRYSLAVWFMGPPYK
jgi:PKHD-type hydroxylase